MSWRDDLRDCSWRGIPCLYDGADDERGRRIVVHDYPQRDEADIEDMGRSVRRYRLTLYVLASALGDAYTQRRDDLIAALEQGGPGELVHPHYGPISVHVERFSPSYSTGQGGMTRMMCEFVEAAAAEQPRQQLRTDALMRSQTDILMDQVDAAFIEQWALDQVPEPVRTAARTTLTIARNTLGLRDDATALRFAGEVFSAGYLADARRVMDLLRQGRAALSRRGLPGVREARGIRSALPTIIGSNDTPTPSTRTAERNQQAVASVVETVTLAAGLDVVSRTVFDSVDEAVAVRDEFVDEIDTLALTASDPVYRALQDARAALVRDIQARGAGLPNVRKLTLAATEPALVVAHRLYGDATREADIVARNRIEHPGFVPGGAPIEVLTDAA